MRFLLYASVLALAGAACDKSDSRPAGSQGTAPTGLPQGEPPPPSPTAVANPHAGGMPGADPHAGLDMGGGGMGGPDMHGQSPVPKDVDPSMVLEGTIEVSPKLKDRVKAGDILFLSVKSVDEAGTPQRIPIAADRQDATTFPMAFKLTGANTMMQGTKFEGSVLVTVRVDRDGEAMSRKPGDIEGSVRAKIPARGLKIVLDTPVP